MCVCGGEGTSLTQSYTEQKHRIKTKTTKFANPEPEFLARDNITHELRSVHIQRVNNDLSRTLWCLDLVYATKSFLSTSSSSGTRSYSLGHLLGTVDQIDTQKQTKNKYQGN